MKIWCTQNNYLHYIGHHFCTKQYAMLKMHRNQCIEPYHAKCRQGIYSTHISNLFQDENYPQQVHSSLYPSLALRKLPDCGWIMCPFCGIQYVYQWGQLGLLCAITHSSEWEWTRYMRTLLPEAGRVEASNFGHAGNFGQTCRADV